MTKFTSNAFLAYSNPSPLHNGVEPYLASACTTSELVIQTSEFQSQLISQMHGQLQELASNQCVNTDMTQGLALH